MSRRDEIAARLAAATPGVKRISTTYDGAVLLILTDGEADMTDADEQLFLNASADLRWLLDENERLRQVVIAFSAYVGDDCGEDCGRESCRIRRMADQALAD